VHRHLPALLSSLLLGKPDLRQLRLGEDRPGNRTAHAADRAGKEGVSRRHVALPARVMRELERADHVPGCVDVVLAGLELLVDADAVLVVVHTGTSQLQPLDVWAAAGRDQEEVCRHAPSSRVGHDLAVVPQYFFELQARLYTDPVCSESTCEKVACFAVRHREQAALLLSECHLRTQMGEGLCQLDSDGPAAQDEQPVGQFLEVEDLFIGPMGHHLQTCYRRALRHRACADDQVARHDATPCHFYACTIEKLRLGQLNLDPASPKLFGRLERVHGCDRLTDAPHHLRKVDFCNLGATSDV